MSEQRLGVLRTGFVGTCALVALVLLAVFYSTVSSAVDRAAQRRLSLAAAPAGAVAAARPAARGRALLARVDN